MTNQDIVMMMQRCATEIKQLRAQVAELSPKAHAYDTIAIHARLLSSPAPQYSGEDLVWKLENEISKLQKEEPK